MIDSPSENRIPNQPLRPECRHKVIEDCLLCAVCGFCRESLDEDDVCIECRTIAASEELPQPCRISMGTGGLLPYVYLAADWICE